MSDELNMDEAMDEIIEVALKACKNDDYNPDIPLAGMKQLAEICKNQQIQIKFLAKSIQSLQESVRPLIKKKYKERRLFGLPRF